MLGTGMLKPNVSVIVGQLYPRGDRRRDSGFSIFYMGINLGALISPIICGWVGEKINWRMGFAISGIGMVAGLIQYWLGGKHLGDAGLYPSTTGDPARDRAQKRTGAYRSHWRDRCDARRVRAQLGGHDRNHCGFASPNGLG